MCSSIRHFSVFVANLILCASGQADVSLSDLFSDHMVIQADQPVSIWGRATPGEIISVTLNAQTAKATTAANGKWSVILPAQKAGGPHVVEITGNNKIVLSDVLIGEVWLASGQSNMNMRVYPTPPWTLGVVDYGRIIAAAKQPEIRFFTVYDESSDSPKDEIHGRWEICSPETVGNFSAVPYFFAKRLQDDLKTPVGMIVSAVGATSILQWLPANQVSAFPGGQQGLELAAKRRENAKDKLEDYCKTQLPAYYVQNQKNRNIPGKLTPHIEPYKGHFAQPSGLYNAMIAPLTDLRIKGFLWWQGESDSSWASGYTEALKTLIESWRDVWKQSDIPFLFVQSGARVPYPPKPTDLTRLTPPPSDNRSKLRLAQAMIEDLVPYSALVVSCDLGHPNVHFPDKKPVGERLVLAALKMVYGQEMQDYKGPVVTAISAEEGAIVLDFESSNGKLVSHSGSMLSGFEIAGEDGKYWPANAKIHGGKVVVSSGFVKSPTIVRYGWGDFPFMSLFDAEGLPARPFVRDVINDKAEDEAIKTSEVPAVAIPEAE